MTSEQRVKARFQEARATRYMDSAGRAYYLVWTKDQYATGARRLGEGKTASAAWVNASRRLEMSRPNVSPDIDRLKSWIRHTGEAEDICTRAVLGEICSTCRCKHGANAR